MRSVFYSLKLFSFSSCLFTIAVKLQVEETESNITVSEYGSVRLGCSIPSQSSKDSRFSVSWYVSRSEREGERECVFSIGHDAVFGNGNCSPMEEPGHNSRLQFERTTSDVYSLTIQRARRGDAGKYYCHVEEWLLNPRNAWYRLTTNNSGATIVNVLDKGTPVILGCSSKLQLSLLFCLMSNKYCFCPRVKSKFYERTIDSFLKQAIFCVINNAFADTHLPYFPQFQPCSQWCAPTTRFSISFSSTRSPSLASCSSLFCWCATRAGVPTRIRKERTVRRCSGSKSLT